MTVPIFQDNLEEMNETFSLVLDLAAAIPLVTVGTLNMAFGNIIDSTGMNYTVVTTVAL